MEIDPVFLAKSMTRLSGIPVRIYRDGTLAASAFPAALPRDPMERYKGEIRAVRGHVGYYCTPFFHYYGVLNADEWKIVAGPTAQIMADEQKMRELAFELDVPADEIPAFLDGMNAIRRLPVETLFQMLCTFNHFLNGGETLELSDLTIRDSVQAELKTGVERTRTSVVYDPPERTEQGHHTLEIEEALMSIVRKGDTVALRRWLASAPAVAGGTMAGDALRQMKNLFVVTATLTSRAAVRGGMLEDDAFSLSDAYIRRAELFTTYDSILNLQYHMLLEFTEQVEKLHRGGHMTKLSLDVANYVRHHLSEPVSVGRMAEEFFISRPYLSAKFKAETGTTLTDFILSEKTEEAKRLIRYTDKSLPSISAYLGFSSQSHFTRVFRKYAGLTPGEYLERHK